MKEADVVIVGGGPAGLTAAIALAAEGGARRAVVLEKGNYPREKYCAGAIGGRGDRILAKLGVEVDVPSARVTGMSYRGTDGAIEVRTGVEIGRVIRRLEFDHALAKIAASRGVEIVEGARVDAIEAASDAAVVSTSAGTFSAKIVVGADGVGSVVRKAMSLPTGRLRAQVLEVDTEPVASDRARDILHFDSCERDLPGYYWDFPTIAGGQDLVCRGVYHLKIGESSEAIDLTERLRARLSRMGLDLDRCKNKRFAERGYEDESLVAKGRLMLAGESAGIDAVTGEGIAQAIELGAMAGPFLARALRGDARVDDWNRVVHRSRIARDFKARRFCAKGFFGPRRPAVERVFLASDSILRAGALHFAGIPQEAYTLARAAFTIVKAWAGIGMGSASRATTAAH